MHFTHSKDQPEAYLQQSLQHFHEPRLSISVYQSTYSHIQAPDRKPLKILQFSRKLRARHIVFLRRDAYNALWVTKFSTQTSSRVGIQHGGRVTIGIDWDFYDTSVVLFSC